jgi:hypothetical protein
MEELEPRPTMAVLWVRGGSDKKGENQSFSVSAIVLITAKLLEVVRYALQIGVGVGATETMDEKSTTYSSFVDGRDRRPSDYITTLQYSLLHDANTSLDMFWPFRHHAFALLQPYIHKLGRSGVFLISALSPLQLRSSIQRAEPLFSVTLLSISGVTESNAGIHATRQPSDQEKQLIDDDVLCLSQLKPSHQTYSHYAGNAVFHDPVSIAQGLDSIKSQFNGMPKLFAESITESMSVKESSFNINIAWYLRIALWHVECDILDSSTPQAMQLNLTQKYVFKSPIPFKEKGAEKTINSKLTFTFSNQGLVEEHLEEWDHKSNKTGSGRFFGRIQEGKKKLDAKMFEKTVPSDPDKKLRRDLSMVEGYDRMTVH